MHELQRAIDAFNRQFAAWDITLPEDEMRDGFVGQIVNHGWTIKYTTGSDDRGRYLDFYAAHRMTNDRHVRLYADGSSESLPALEGMRAASDDPAEDARLAAEHIRRHREIEAMLDAKGFGIRGDEHGSLLIQRHAMRPSEERP